MNGMTRFDYGDLSESEQRHLERQADKIADARRVVAKSAVETGKVLSEVRDRLANRGDGTFNRWVEERCGITPRHARNFIAAFEVFGGKEWENVFPFFDDSSLFLLSTPSAEPARKEAMRLAVSGKAVTHKVAKSLVEKHKPADNSYVAHGLPGAGRSGKGSRNKRDPAKELEQVNRDQSQEVDEPAESAGAGQPADDRGGVGTVSTAGESDPIDASCTVIETTGRVVEVGMSETVEADPELALRDALLPLLRMANRLSNDLIKPHVAKCLNDAIEMLSTGEPIEPPSLPAVIDPKPTANEITGEPSVMVFPIIPSKKGGCAEWELSQAYVDELQEVYVGLDVLSVCRQALLWCRNNPTKRKTAKGMREFLRRWCEREQNRGGGGGGRAASPSVDPRPSDPRLSVYDEYIAKYGEAS